MLLWLKHPQGWVSQALYIIVRFGTELVHQGKPTLQCQGKPMAYPGQCVEASMIV